MKAIKRASKSQRELAVLLACVELYIQTGRPVASSTLKEHSFGDLSSATIRNYFAVLEEEGLLKQHHASGGRIPTDRAYRFYLTSLLEQEGEITKGALPKEMEAIGIEGRDIGAFLQRAGEALSSHLKLSLFLSFPRFEQDYLVKIRAVHLDLNRILVAMVTQFGEVFTEILSVSDKLSSQALLRVESYFDWKLRGSTGMAPPLSRREVEVAQNLYQELALRYIVKQKSFFDEDIFRCGFSHLLHFSDYQEPASLLSTLGLFESLSKMRKLLRETISQKRLTCWLGSELHLIQEGLEDAALICIPYRVAHSHVGAIALLAPLSVDYKRVLRVFLPFVEKIERVLTEAVYRFSLSYRVPPGATRFVGVEEKVFLQDLSKTRLIEQKKKES